MASMAPREQGRMDEPTSLLVSMYVSWLKGRGRGWEEGEGMGGGGDGRKGRGRGWEDRRCGEIQEGERDHRGKGRSQGKGGGTRGKRIIDKERYTVEFTHLWKKFNFFVVQNQAWDQFLKDILLCWCIVTSPAWS